MNAEIDVSNVVLHTDRLILRPFTLNDLDDFYEYASMDGVGQPAGWLPHQDKEESLTVLQRFVEEKKTFALELDGKVVGSLGIEEYDEEQLTEFRDKLGREIGYVLSKPYWGRGLMTEAVKSAVGYLFNELGLDFIVCGHFTDNPRSMRVQEKCGFTHYKLIETDFAVGAKKCWLSILEREKYEQIYQTRLEQQHT